MAEDRDVGQDTPGSEPGVSEGRERGLRPPNDRRSAVSADANTLGELQGSLTQVSHQVGELLDAVRRDAADIRARAEQDARAIRAAAAADAARQQAEIDELRREAKSEAAQRRAELDRLRRDVQAEAARQRAELDRLVQDAQAERDRVDRILDMGLRALAATQSALMFDAGPVATGELAAVIPGRLSELAAPSSSATTPDPSGTRGGTGVPAEPPATVGRGANRGSRAARPPGIPRAAAETPGPDTAEVVRPAPDDRLDGEELDGPAGAETTTTGGSHLVAAADEHLRAGDVSAAIELFRAVEQHPEQAAAVITRLMTLVNDVEYESHRDELLEVLAEAYLVRTDPVVQ